MNTLATILDDADNRALIEKWLSKTFLARRTYDTPLANAKTAMRQDIPAKSGQYIEMTRKGRFRLPENVNLANETADPASGASMGVDKVKLPIEFIHEYIPIGTIAEMTSWIDLKTWAKEDLPEALRRRLHQLAQNAFVVGRFKPGRYAADGTVAVPFDDTVENTAVSMYGLEFTWQRSPLYYANNRPSFNALQPGDLSSMDDFKNIRVRMARAGARKINGKYVAYISDAMSRDLQDDDEYFRAAIHAFNGKGLVDGMIADYAGFMWVIDDEPYTEHWLAENVRAEFGEIHSAIICGKDAWGYIGLGGKSRFKPRFKVQDITKTGSEFTIGYMVPAQTGLTNSTWTAVYKAPVREYQANGS